MKTQKTGPLVVCGLLAVLVLAGSGCKTKSALDSAVEERLRWKVIALDWTQTPQQEVLLSTRLSGPPRTELKQLTIKIVLQDAAGATIQDAWHTFDLTGIQRGGPKDFNVRVQASEPIENLGVDPVDAPTAEDVALIPELRGLE